MSVHTALPCTTPRPAPKSSTDDLARNFWDSGSAANRRPLTLVGSRRAERGPVVNRLNPHADASPHRGSRISSTDQAFAPKTKKAGTELALKRALLSNRDGSRYGHPDNDSRISLRIVAVPQHRFHLQRPSGVIVRT